MGISTANLTTIVDAAITNNADIDGISSDISDVYDRCGDIQTLITALNDPSTAQITAAILAATGITAGGTWNVAKAIKVFVAWSVGNWQDKAGVPGTYQILDPDDGTTIIAEIIPGIATPYKQVTVF